MNHVLFAVYVFSHLAGFAGYALMIPLRDYHSDSSSRLLSYTIFLFSFFLYLLPSNVAFFANVFLAAGSQVGESWYYLADAVRTSFLLATASWFFWSLPRQTGSRKTLVALLVLSALPLAGLAVQATLVPNGVVSPGATVTARRFLMRAHVFLIAGLLAWSCRYFRARRAYASAPMCRKMMDISVAGNIAFIPFFVGFSFVNLGADRPGLPLCPENFYYLAVHAANIAVLAREGLGHAEETAASRPHSRDRPPEEARRIASSLTEYERNVIELLSRGHANKQIAATLSVSEHAVRNHVYRLFKRFGVRNRVELADLYRKTIDRPDRVSV